jgi:hypothetical protein
MPRRLELYETQQHRQSSGQKAVAEIEHFADGSRNEWREQATQIDTHVKDRKGGITEGTRLAFVQFPDQRADIRLEQPCAKCDDQQTADKCEHAGRHSEEAVSDRD